MSAKQSTATKESKKVASSAADFKKLKKGQLVTLPSGLSVTARRVPLSTFVRQGDVPNPLLPIVDEALNRGKAVEASSLMGEDGVDMDTVNSMLEMVDAVVIEALITPKVHPVPTEDEDGDPFVIGENWATQAELDAAIDEARDDDLLYIDEVDDEDKMFIFQWVLGGTGDVERFRAEAEADVASLVQKQGGGKKSKRNAGSKKR